jgi:hypothetical protein
VTKTSAPVAAQLSECYAPIFRNMRYSGQKTGVFKSKGETLICFPITEPLPSILSEVQGHRQRRTHKRQYPTHSPVAESLHPYHW